MIRFSWSLFFIFVVAIGAPKPGLGQDVVSTEGSRGVVLPTPSLTETSDATASSVNPANLAFLDSWSFVYAGAWLQDQRHLADQGHGFFFGFPFGPFALALSVEALTPPAGLDKWLGLNDRVRFSLAFAAHIQRAMSVGVAYRTFWSYGEGDLDTFDIGLTVHPINQIAMSFVASDVNAPKIPVDSTMSKTFAPRRFNVGLTIRPLGNDRLSLGGELHYLYGDDYSRTDLSGLFSAMIVNGLSIRGRFGAQGVGDEDFDRAYFLDATVSLDLPHFGIAGGPYAKIGPMGDEDILGAAWSVRLSGAAAPGITLPRSMRAIHAVVISIESPIGQRELASMVRKFERIERDRGIDMIILKPEPGTIGLTASMEFGRMIEELQESDVQVMCYLKEATGSVYTACGGADHIWINPAGGIRFAGLSSRLLFFGDLLSRFGVKADIVRIGDYKSAPESYMSSGPSEASSEQMNRYMDSLYDTLLQSLVGDRAFKDMATIEAIVEKGPFTAREALDNGLVDRLVALDEFDEVLEEVMEKPVFVDDVYIKKTFMRRHYVDSPSVAVLHIDGDIIDGESLEIPFVGIKMAGSKTLIESIRALKADSRVHAVVLRINSPGGSALASDLIWREVMALREVKPVIASLGSVAASGGYYIASAATEIYCEPTTLTGSIGIFYGKADISGLMERVGVGVTTFKRGSHADLQSLFREYTPQERARLQDQIGQYYDLFLERVVEGRGRGFTKEIVDGLGQGRIWSGVDARYHMLVDQLGGYREALDRARGLGGVRPEMRVAQFPTVGPGILWRLVTSVSVLFSEPSAMEALFSTTGMDKVLGLAYPFASVDEATPRARLPFTVEVDD